MIPVLYESTATTFTSCGLGELVDALSCIVTEDENGQCSLEMEYPTDAIRYPDIATGRLIKAASAPGEYNIFCLKDLDYSTEGVVKIHAPQEMCFRLSSAKRFLAAKSYTWTASGGAGGNDIRDVFHNHLLARVRPHMTEVTDEHGLVVVPGCTFTGDFSLELGTQRYINWGKERPSAFELTQAVAEGFGGEIRWGFNRVDVLQRRGSDTGLEIRYGVNMLKLDAETSGETYITAAMPAGSEDVDTDYVRADSPGVFPFFRIAEVEEGTSLTDYLESSATLKTAIKVEFDAEGHANVDYDGDIWQLHLYDTVTVVHPVIELRQEAKIVQTVFDSLLERYISLSVGEILKDITDTIAALIRGK